MSNAKNEPMPENGFTTIISKELADELDEGFSPMDGLIAIDQICIELPRLHRPAHRSALQRCFGQTRKLYHGRYDWYPLGFTYEQIGNELHIVNLWMVQETGFFRRRTFDVVLGADESFYQIYDADWTGGKAA